MRRRLSLPVLLTLLVWIVQSDCRPLHLRIWEWYLEGPGAINATWGYRLLPPSQSSYDLLPFKPDEPGCAISWWWPEALDGDGHLMPAECQPVPVAVDGAAWEGM